MMGLNHSPPLISHVWDYEEKAREALDLFEFSFVVLKLYVGRHVPHHVS